MPEITQTMMLRLVVGRRIANLVVAAMAKRDVACTQIVVPFDQGEVLANGVTILDTNIDRAFSYRFQAIRIVGCHGQFRQVVVFLDRLMNGVKDL